MDNEGGKRKLEHLLSLLIVVAAVMVLFVFVNRVSPAVERARVQYTLSGLRSGIQVRELTALVTGKSDALAARAGTNPVELLDTPPAAYAGFYAGAGELRAGRWYFDAGTGELVYAVINRKNFDAARELRFRLEYVPAVENIVGRLRLVAAGDGEQMPAGLPDKEEER